MRSHNAAAGRLRQGFGTQHHNGTGRGYYIPPVLFLLQIVTGTLSRCVRIRPCSHLKQGSSFHLKTLILAIIAFGNLCP